VTGADGYPSAVLMRGAGPWNGPAKLTKALSIDKRFNALHALPATGLWIEDRGVKIPRRRVRRTPRIGVDYSGTWAAKPYRFVLDSFPELEAEFRAITNCASQENRGPRQS
jgi:DNA-3-methyladenine glycosylase